MSEEAREEEEEEEGRKEGRDALKTRTHTSESGGEITIPKYPNSDNFRMIFPVTSWYVVHPGISHTSWYLVLHGISYFLVLRTLDIWYLVVSGILCFRTPWFLASRTSWYLLSRNSWYLVVLPGISHLLVSRTSWYLILPDIA